MTGLLTMDQRYYASSYGRFNTVDPMRMNINLQSPGTWNSYAYANGDPVGNNDRRGLLVDSGSGGTYCSQFPDDPECAVCQEVPDSPGFLDGNSGLPVESAAPPSSPLPTCDPNGNSVVANNIQFIQDYYVEAQTVSSSSGVPTGWILGWAALESGKPPPQGTLWGQLPQATNGDNNFFGETGTGWNGQTSCPVAVTTNQGKSTFACFSWFGASAEAALSSFGGKYGNILAQDAAAGIGPAAAFQAVYSAGWNSANLAAGTTIASIITRAGTGVDALVNCLQSIGYLP